MKSLLVAITFTVLCYIDFADSQAGDERLLAGYRPYPPREPGGYNNQYHTPDERAASGTIGNFGTDKMRNGGLRTGSNVDLQNNNKGMNVNLPPKFMPGHLPDNSRTLPDGRQFDGRPAWKPVDNGGTPIRNIHDPAVQGTNIGGWNSGANVLPVINANGVRGERGFDNKPNIHQGTQGNVGTLFSDLNKDDGKLSDVIRDLMSNLMRKQNTGAPLKSGSFADPGKATNGFVAKVDTSNPGGIQRNNNAGVPNGNFPQGYGKSPLGNVVRLPIPNGQPVFRPPNSASNVGQPVFRPPNSANNVGQPVFKPPNSASNVGQPLVRPPNRASNVRQPVFRPPNSASNVGQTPVRPVNIPVAGGFPHQVNNVPNGWAANDGTHVINTPGNRVQNYNPRSGWNDPFGIVHKPPFVGSPAGISPLAQHGNNKVPLDTNNSPATTQKQTIVYPEKTVSNASPTGINKSTNQETANGSSGTDVSHTSESPKTDNGSGGLDNSSQSVGSGTENVKAASVVGSNNDGDTSGTTKSQASNKEIHKGKKTKGKKRKSKGKGKKRKSKKSKTPPGSKSAAHANSDIHDDNFDETFFLEIFDERGHAAKNCDKQKTIKEFFDD